jgi:hypothetical protein
MICGRISFLWHSPLKVMLFVSTMMDGPSTFRRSHGIVDVGLISRMPHVSPCRSLSILMAFSFEDDAIRVYNDGPSTFRRSRCIADIGLISRMPHVSPCRSSSTSRFKAFRRKSESSLIFRPRMREEVVVWGSFISLSNTMKRNSLAFSKNSRLVPPKRT